MPIGAITKPTASMRAAARRGRRLSAGIGYGLHLIADTQYEIPVAFALTPASVSEQPTLRAMIRATFSEPPELAQRCKDFSADRGLDSAETKALLWDDYGVRPLLDTRPSSPNGCGAKRRTSPTTTRPSPSRARSTPRGPIPSCIPKKAPYTASVR